MKKTLLSVLFILVLLGSVYSAEEYSKVRLRMSISGTDLGMDGLTANMMKKLLKERSGGAITLEVYPNAQLASGSMARQTEMLIEGSSFECGIIAETIFSTFDPKLNVSGLPFSFASYDAAYKYADSTGGEWSKKTFAKLGLTRLDCLSNSIMHLTNNKRPLLSPADVKGLKMRSYGEMQMKLMKELGADPVQMAWSEVYSAMQTKTIDGHMNGFQTLQSANIQEVQKYITVCGVMWSAYDVLFNTKAWNKLDAKTQKLFSEVTREACLWAREYLKNEEGKIRQKFEAFGVKITDLTPAQLQAFVDGTAETRKYFIEMCGPEACAAWGIK